MGLMGSGPRCHPKGLHIRVLLDGVFRESFSEGKAYGKVS